MLAKRAGTLPPAGEWMYEPKWDGFRAIVFFDGDRLLIQSRDRKPLNRYFPELEAALTAALPRALVLDGEIVIATGHGLDFGALQQRIHPAESRVRKLAAETPSAFVAFDLLALGDAPLLGEPFEARRDRLEATLEGVRPPLYLTPATTDRATAEDWFQRFEGAGLDGVIAKRLDSTYEPGVRSMLKIKHLRTVDCVIGGLRWGKDAIGTSVGSLLLGLYDDDGTLHYVGHTSSFKAPERALLAEQLAAYTTEDEGEGFGGGRAPGGDSRWTGARDNSWIRLRPELVCEVTFDHLQERRFRHASTFQRWRVDKPPHDCGFDQLDTTIPVELATVFAAR